MKFIFLFVLINILLTIFCSDSFSKTYSQNNQSIKQPSEQNNTTRNEVLSSDLKQYPPNKRNTETRFYLRDHTLDNGTLLSRPVPSIPPKAKTSGTCKYEILIDEKGGVALIESLECSPQIYLDPTRKILFSSKYHPKINSNGDAIPFRESSTVTYRLTNKEGDIIPEE